MQKEITTPNPAAPPRTGNNHFLISVLTYSLVTFCWQGVEAFHKTKPWGLWAFLPRFVAHLIIPFVLYFVSLALWRFAASLWRQNRK